MVTSGAFAREDAELYRTILDELGASATTGALEDEDQARETFSKGRATITIAAPQTLDAAKGHNSMLIARLDPAETKKLAARVPQIATLPDL